MVNYRPAVTPSFKNPHFNLRKPPFCHFLENAWADRADFDIFEVGIDNNVVMDILVGWFEFKKLNMPNLTEKH